MKNVIQSDVTDCFMGYISSFRFEFYIQRVIDGNIQLFITIKNIRKLPQTLGIRNLWHNLILSSLCV